LITARYSVLLLRPFGFHLAVDTLPSGVLPRKPTSSPLSRQRGITPAFGHGTPHPGARGTSTLLNNVLLSTHYGRSDSGPLRRGSARVISRFDRPTGSYTDRSPGFTLLAFGPFRLQPPAAASSRQGTLPVGGSPPVAPHHASRRDLALQRDRSYVRLQVTLTWRGLSPLRPSALSGAPDPSLRSE